MADWTEAAGPLAGKICADTPYQNIYTLSPYISGFRADGWMDMDLEGLAGEDRQMRGEGKQDKMSHTMFECKSGARSLWKQAKCDQRTAQGFHARTGIALRLQKPFWRWSWIKLSVSLFRRATKSSSAAVLEAHRNAGTAEDPIS